MRKDSNYSFYTLILIIVSMIIGGWNNCNGQSFPDTIGYDKMEEYSWSGNWWNNKNYTGFATNVSISSPTSAYLYGTGNANSKAEDNWYSLPIIDTLNPLQEYKVKFHVCSQRITSTGGTSGIDIDDFIDIQASVNGGPYISEIRITGNNNAYWDYNSKTISKVIDGLTEIYTPSGGGDRTSLGDGFSIIELIFPIGTTSIAIDVYTKANSSGEEFWFDNFFMLGSGSGGGSLPIVLTSFTSEVTDDNSVNLMWSVASQVNNDYFTIERSYDCYSWEVLENINGAGTNNTQMYYSISDDDPIIGTSYYRLSQTDFNGDFEFFRPISVDVKDDRTIGLNIMPNPAIDNIQIKLMYPDQGLINHNISIYNSKGDQVYKKFYIGRLEDFNIDIKKFKPGYYIVKSRSDKLFGEGKFIKK